MGQQPSKDKLTHSSSERINGRERFSSFSKKGSKKGVQQVTQVLTASKLTPRTTQNNTNEVKKSTPNSSLREPKPKLKRPTLTPKDKKPVAKECGRATVKGGRTSPVIQTRAPPKPVPRVAEALAVLVQHLVFKVEAFQVPHLKREVERYKREIEDKRSICQELEESLVSERAKQEEQTTRHANEIEELEEKHRQIILELNSQQYDLERRLQEDNEADRLLLSQQNDEKLLKLKVEFQKLQKAHEESFTILTEENDSIREQIDEKNAEIKTILHESNKLKEDYEAKEMKLKEQLQNVTRENQKMRAEMTKMEEKIKERIQSVYDENAMLKEENERLLNYSDVKGEGGISVQEVQSLRAVLELKQNEVAELRRNLAEARQKNDILATAEEKAAALSARCEDLQLQLQRKSEYEQSLITENSKLHDNLKEEVNQKKRLSQYTEELQWKLKQNKEVVSKVLEQAEESVFNRTLLSASFNERHVNSPSRTQFERTLSLRDQKSPRRLTRSPEEEPTSPPTSPKVKGVVEKSDWVSYVLDLDESPDVVASRIVRRSFRNSTPPKTTPTKSPGIRSKIRTKNPLCLSASAGAIVTPTSPRNPMEYNRSFSARNNGGMTTSDWRRGHKGIDLVGLDLEDDGDEVDIRLPALPSEIGRKNGNQQALPSPKHLAGEAMVSESNSEDESTSSSSVQL